eukprot:Blabericola_migrator_1__13529@NODE_98_length_14373_cov_122_493220_g88_i0_p7_GENE_NODE_98_length_14373_cov_122_493220_g88_i0NODE_98_length_14373_cov_122_493220_g88_i0_p7_ORF_typecomplete_len198_score60_25HOOK/PF05622_12/0_0012HOOK/PF05622_12/6_7ATG16/PF08614_11/0_0084ATG16/PF08614_11/19DUF3584/PF12128_8/0_014KASH_CCD/PF14662_6/0_025KASH_CCD/PF14662_6/0_59Mod_r/PF07200_13/0_26Mod_r/PF07200_13/2_6PNKP_ligase/PF16542_5/0_11CALCOCO1/PF07888_11/0_27CALCOCO1/PF07888_11/4_4Golgin_A5/PF09787_9/0_096Golgi
MSRSQCVCESEIRFWDSESDYTTEIPDEELRESFEDLKKALSRVERLAGHSSGSRVSHLEQQLEHEKKKVSQLTQITQSQTAAIASLKKEKDELSKTKHSLEKVQGTKAYGIQQLKDEKAELIDANELLSNKVDTLMKQQNKLLAKQKELIEKHNRVAEKYNTLLGEQEKLRLAKLSVERALSRKAAEVQRLRQYYQ